MRDFNLKLLKRRCLAHIEDFLVEGVDLIDGPPHLIFKDNGSDILGVAHLDHVQDTTHFQTVAVRKGRRILKHLVFNGQLDDRLGVYLLLDYLPQLGLKYDLLLTEDEERCASTAMLFQPPRQYNWMFSFDREGSGAVLYEYDDNKAFTAALHKAGLRTSRGTYSDIRELEHLECCGVNVGTGLRNGHGTLAYTDLLVLRKQVARFRRFYKQNASTRFSHDPRPRWQKWGNQLALPLPEYERRGSWKQDDSSYTQCKECEEYMPSYEIHAGICLDCWEELSWGNRQGDLCECPLCGGYVRKKEIGMLAGIGPVCADCRKELKDDGVA